MTHDTPAYGLWSLVVINTAVFLIFAFSLARPAPLATGVRFVPSPLYWLRCLRIGPRSDRTERGYDV
jgi:hypothetical protein